MTHIYFFLFSGSFWIILLKILFVLSFVIMVVRLPIRTWEKVCWIVLAFLFTALAIFIFYVFRHSYILLKRKRRKFNPRFNRTSDETRNSTPL
ncbi:MAG: hypothetical protein ACOVMQ_08425 [Cyclobacteriaceae bacterium]